MKNRHIVITGPPKSGTTYLGSILYDFSNTVVLNEPPLSDAMHKESGVGVRELFDYYRAEITAHREVHSTLKANGRLITNSRTENPLIVNVRGVHKFDNEDFILGIKNPQFFMGHIPGIIKHMPYARLAVIVRNPLDTVGSMRRFAGGGMAKEWRTFTDLVLDNIDSIILIRYQDAVLKPKETVSRIFGDWGPGRPLFDLEPSEIQYSRDCMKDGDAEDVEKYCKENAIKLGVWYE